jgi:uncharacterized protein (TIRG00374 family)
MDHDAAAQTEQPRWLWGLFLLVGLAAFTLAVYGADLGRAVELTIGLGASALVLLVPQGLWNVIHAGAWRQLLVTLGHRVSIARLTGDYLASEAARKTMPAGVVFGETLGAYLLRQGSAVPIPDAMASLAVKRCLVVLSHGLFGVVALAVGGGAIARASVGQLSLWWLLAVTAAALLLAGVAVAVAMKRRALAGNALRLVARALGRRARALLEAQAARVEHADERLARPFALRSAPETVAAALLLLLQWLVEAYESYLMLTLLGAPTAPATVVAVEVLVAFARSAAFVLPSGLGVQDLGYVAMFGAFGVPEAATVGATFVVLKRLKELAWIGAGYVVLLGRRERASAARR